MNISGGFIYCARGSVLIREVSLFQWWMNTHSHCARTRGSVLIREVSLFQWWMNTHSHCAGTRGSVLIREVSLFQWWMNTHSHCAGTRRSVLIREVSLFLWWMNTHSHCAGTRGSVLIREVSLFQWWMNTHSHCAGTRTMKAYHSMPFLMKHAHYNHIQAYTDYRHCKTLNSLLSPSSHCASELRPLQGCTVVDGIKNKLQLGFRCGINQNTSSIIPPLDEVD